MTTGPCRTLKLVPPAPPSTTTTQQARLLYGRKEAAHQLSISVRSLDYLIAEGRLRPRRIGGRVLIHHDDLVRLAARGDSDSMKPAA